MTTAPLTNLIVRCYPGEEGAADLYEDDGQTQAYMNGAFGITTMNYQRANDTVEIKVGPSRGAYTGQPKDRSYQIELPSTTKASHATCNGQLAAVQYDAGRSMNIVKVPPTPITQVIDIQIQTIGDSTK